MKTAFYLDLRALALMRIALALVLLLDLSIRLCHLEAFYSNTGAVPLTMLFQYNWNDYFFSFHTLSGMWQVELLLFLANIYCVLMLLVGKHTRVFTFLCWIFMLSLHNRNPLILQGGDDLMRMLLFWGMFMPWNKRYSVDAADSNLELKNNNYMQLAGLAYVLQLVYLYSFSALLKGAEWDKDFTAVYYAYSLDQIAYSSTKLIYYYPELLKMLTAIAYYFELLVPVLFFAPIFNSQFRMLAVFMIISFHLFNGFMLQIGLFFIVGIVSSIGVLPAEFFDFLELRFQSLKQRLSMFFLRLSRLLNILERIEFREIVNAKIRGSISSILIFFFLIYVFIWNVNNLTFSPYKMTASMRTVGYFLRLDQNWGMFAPGVIKDNGWYILEGTLANGKKIDLWQDGRELTYKKPKSIVSLFPNDRWRKYGENMMLQRNAFMRGYFCNYSKRVWNEKHPEQAIKALNVMYMYQLTQPDYKVQVPKRELLCGCGN